MKKVNILRIVCLLAAITCVAVNEGCLVDGDDAEKTVLFFAMVAALSNLQLTYTAPKLYEP
jgi:hypothetical protein